MTPPHLTRSGEGVLQFVLEDPGEKVWIWGFLVGEASRCEGTRMRAINILVEVVSNEDSFNLKLLREIVCGGEFDDVLM